MEAGLTRSASAQPDAEVLLRLEGLEVDLPDGRPLIRGLELTVRAGEVVAVLGGSGAGKSTLAAALFEPERLRQTGYTVRCRTRELAPAALVPQQGAPFDHLDVRGNVALAQRWRDAPDPGDPGRFLELVRLPPELARRGAPADRLSGGQAQRLAVARALAAGRALLFLDEPSAGLDPHTAAGLADLLREEARRAGVGVVLVTHDTLLAARAADRALLLEPRTGALAELPVDPADRSGLEAALFAALAAAEGAPTAPRRRRPLLGRIARGLDGLWRRTLGSLEVPAIALAQLGRVRPWHLPGLARVAARVWLQALLRPAAFYAVVSALLGFTVLYILVRAAPAGLSPSVLLDLVGGSHVLALAPPLSAILFVATSGSAVNAWLGSMALSRQLTALRVLGIRVETYLWLPAFLALAAAYLATAALFAGGLILGGAAVHLMQDGGELGPVLLRLVGDLIDPVPERRALRDRALWLVLLYAPGLAADVVHRGAGAKATADDVTRSMTGSVVAATLWVVALELASSVLLFRSGG